jgi:hypothetical protein
MKPHPNLPLRGKEVNTEMNNIDPIKGEGIYTEKNNVDPIL